MYRWNPNPETMPTEEVWSHLPGSTVELHWQNEGFYEQGGHWQFFGVRGDFTVRTWGFWTGTKTDVTSEIVWPL